MATRNRSTRSLERDGETLANPSLMLDRLTQTLERLLSNPQRKESPFRLPPFEGKGDVEYFIRRFNEVSEANKWDERTATIHLREALKGSATDCGKAHHLDGILTALRARYGLTARKARLKLNSLKKDPKMSLQEHANEVQKLADLAYGDLPPEYQAHLVVETFCNTLGNPYLQRHLLAFPMANLEEMVRAGNEYLQIKAFPSGLVRNIEDEEISTNQVKPETDLLADLTKVVQNLARKVEEISKEKNHSPMNAFSKNNNSRAGFSCWGCGQEGHNRSNCPTNPWQKRNSNQSGNVRGLLQ